MAKQSAATAPTPTKPYVMPLPESGVVIWHYADASGKKGCTAIVTGINSQSIDVMAFPSGAQLRPFNGVKYIGDPSLKAMTQPNPGGVWDFTATEKAVRAMSGPSYE